jgi:branched-chain amino acid transport system substrate-binding protein
VRFSSKGIAGLVAGAGLAAMSLTACGTTAENGGTADGGDCSVKLAFLGPMTGDYANLGINIINGAKVALEEYNETDPECEVEIEEFDSQGDPEKAKPLATKIIGDEDIVGVMGPTFSGESDATGPAFAEAGLVTVSSSATNPDLTTHGWDTFHRILGNDALQAPAAAKFLTDTLKAKKVMVVDDASEYGKGLGDGIRKALGDVATESDQVQQKQTDFSATVTKAKASGTDALYFAGYYGEAGLLAKQLKQGGYKGTFVSGDGTLDPGFIEGAGAAANGSYLTCPCLWATGEWADKYKEVNGTEPGTYSGEGYDVANVFLQGIAEGHTDRESLLEWVNEYDADGVKDGEIQAGVEIK